MCGIAGVVGWKLDQHSAVAVGKMADALIHRGPDDGAVWSDSDSGVSLGHRRLSILELSVHGSQPMVSDNERFVIVFNGEIYNFNELRQKLIDAGCSRVWRGHSDTEVLLTAIEAWGVQTTLENLVGMFAFAVWDKVTKTITLARDRMGEKPLYYGILGNRFVFSSELKAIKAAFSGELRIDRRALAKFVQYGYVPAPDSIYEGIKKLKPAHYLTVDSLNCAQAPVSYWSLKSSSALKDELSQATDKEVVGVVGERLSTAVKSQMIADVPLGAFLSGGVDSSLIVSLMQAQSPTSINTYTIGFNEPEFDEAPYAKAIAKHLGTTHTEFYLSADDAVSIIPSLPDVYDEPFADSSQIPTILVSRMTKQYVTVALSGDGGDELFAGYPRYQITAGLWERIKKLPLPARHIMAYSLRSLSSKGWDNVCSILPGTVRAKVNGRRIYRMSELLASENLAQMYTGLMSQWQPTDDVVLGIDDHDRGVVSWESAVDYIEEMRRWDVSQYLPDDLLVKVDRGAMSASLETRAPLLDHRVAELAFSLSSSQLIKSGVGKWPLRELLKQYVPTSFFDRPKAGFSIPLAEWLRGPLKGWAEDLLAEERIKREGYFDCQKIRSAWLQHQNGTYDRSLHLWNILMFQSWLDRNSR
ncbi:asparagine synthase (glutamine-hydrolyzing) [Pseudomonas svalbardensis]|uniref:asparagine synthase (glutamine-hydrolyzing) n=1 Tax=Pseudomonas svalbardensis TaxID=3042029 RepID=UPI0024B369D3|nr:asparagine synthase (glutamine-hydrolyzing) [Pseudomonas sp. PMCC200367]